MAAEGEALTVSGYIIHHLTNLTYGKLPAGFVRDDGSIVGEGGLWTIAHGGAEASAMGFNAIKKSYFFEPELNIAPFYGPHFGPPLPLAPGNLFS